MENKEVKTELKEGEWTVEGRFIYILHNPDGRHLRNKFHAQVTPGWFGEVPVPEAEAEKVACVFGAAYDMLEALKELIRFENVMNWSAGDLQYPDNFLKAIESAKAAIKKAQPHE